MVRGRPEKKQKGVQPAIVNNAKALTKTQETKLKKVAAKAQEILKKKREAEIKIQATPALADHMPRVARTKADEAIAALECEVASIDMCLEPRAVCTFADVLSAAEGVCTKAESAVKALQSHLASAEKSHKSED